MELKNSIHEIDFADSEVVAYHSKGYNVVIILKAWNSELIELEFVGCILFFISGSWDISEMCEKNSSILFKNALNTVYDNQIPSVHNYKLFQFLHVDDFPVIEVGCESIIIKNKNNNS